MRRHLGVLLVRGHSRMHKLSAQAVRTILVGDMNVHHMRWLRYSSKNSTEGNALRSFCQDFGFQQLVREPTRGDHLLDLALSDKSTVGCKVLVGGSDEKAARDKGSAGILAEFQKYAGKVRMPVMTAMWR